MGLKRIFWKTADRIEIWCTTTFKYNPRQQALEIKQDLFPDPITTEAIDKALGLNNHDNNDNRQDISR